MPLLSTHSLQSTATLPPMWASSPPPRESCDELCRCFADQASVSTLLGGEPVTVFNGVVWQLFDWSERGCPFAELLTKWFVGLNAWSIVNITLQRKRHPKGMQVEAQLFELSAGRDIKANYIEMATDQS